MKEVTLRREMDYLCSEAFPTSRTRGRLFPADECPVRTEFQRDRDRITHSKSFRRLMHKMQVFIAPKGDHYRTRLTHTLEVAQIARTLARALSLNEDLTEASALGHDLGHTPFGHSGERALNKLHPSGFRHYEQSLRVVDRLENNFKGLNLTHEVRDAIRNHSGDCRAETLEGRIVKFADRIAYINHDIDDAVRAGILQPEAIPEDISVVLGNTHSDRITTLVSSVTAYGVQNSVGMTEPQHTAMLKLRKFMFDEVYNSPAARSEEQKVSDLVEALYTYYLTHIDTLPAVHIALIEEDGRETVVCDHIASMTDRYALAQFEELFVPRVWQFT